ncbi:MAG: DNA topoisomerase I [Dehalococcoidales bacterium]|nr:DNA topoisomerase I [Dehalococcoidales bacterium]MDP6576827.1 type I DNA topoisomerase [Dehalococcoidales bacterium]
MSKNLVIVESPAKARTLEKILGKSYSLKASLGHVRDLPRGQLGVDVENGFTPRYVVPRVKNKLVKELKKAAQAATIVYLATDPDREGEAIAWHLAEVTESVQKSCHRVVFHEITKEAVKNAFKHPRTIDMQLVNAQQARRVLDRLVGYKISPLLWQKVRRGLSAGRVQSVALKIIVDREQEIERFVQAEYWTIEAELAKKTGDVAFRARLINLVGDSRLDIPNRIKADQFKKKLKKASYHVLKVNTKKVTRQPAPPFITSTLQQEAWRKLHFTAKQTMAVAQQLYEGLPLGSEGNVGLITYMRTDSTRVAHSAITDTRNFINRKYGPKFVPLHPRSFTKSVKRAQEAHEAIRPTRVHREPSLIKKYLTVSQFRLYDLIWKRLVASQMAVALFDNTTVDIEARCSNSVYLFRTSSSVNKFPGFIILYSESKDETEEEKKMTFPPLKSGNNLKLLDLFSEQHFTQPPPRFTEATLIKLLEQWGIGRPSTYAPIISTIQGREYVTKMKGSFQPTELGRVVNDLLGQFFTDIVDIKFTATLEDELDEIVSQNRGWANVVQDFYTPLEKDLEKAFQSAKKVKLPDELTDELCPKCDKPMAIKIGRFGKFLACSGYPECKHTKSFQIKIGVKCPQCDGELIKRMSAKKKRVFYGCSNYPDCQFSINLKPLPQPCPKCGGFLTLFMRRMAKCTKCEFKGKIPSS